MPYDPSKEPKLRVLARGTAMVPHYESLMDARVRRFHGWKHDPNIGEAFEEIDDNGRRTGRILKQGAFVKGVGDIIELPMRGEYLRHLRDGDLWPADQKTASLAGVPFDPTFGNEHTKGGAVDEVLDPIRAASGLPLSQEH